MTIGQTLLAVIIGLAVSEVSELCPWAARKLIRWSAHRRYAPPPWAELRAEELAAYLDDRPGRALKLITALGFTAAALATRKTAPSVAPPVSQWWPTRLTVPVHYEYDEWIDFFVHPNARTARQSWHQLVDSVRDAAKEVGVRQRSWRRCIKELQRITRDDRWMTAASNLNLLEGIYKSRRKLIPIEYKEFVGIPDFRKQFHWCNLTDSTIMHYQAAIDTAHVEIRSLTSDFLLSSALG
jgi:hypothetical protein